MRVVWVMMLFAMTGCAQWNAAQMDLATQARRGVANVAKRGDERAATVKELSKLRRQRLDEAFDADVRQRAGLEPEWVIEHRQAYAAALDAYARDENAQEAAILAEKRDLEAVDAALERLLWLQSIQSKFDVIGEVLDGKH